MKRPIFRRPREPRTRPLTDEQIRARLAERGDLPTDLDVQLLRWTKAENTRRTP
jgi:hypothetical protein